jgi:hypothetical protein
MFPECCDFAGAVNLYPQLPQKAPSRRASPHSGHSDSFAAGNLNPQSPQKDPNVRCLPHSGQKFTVMSRWLGLLMD